MKQQLIETLNLILDSDTSIKSHVAKIKEIREQLHDYITEDEVMQITNSIKSKIQHEARLAFYANNSWGCVYMATGTGKSKVAIDFIEDLTLRTIPNWNALSASRNSENRLKGIIVVPTEKLRDVNWPNELRQWGVNPEGIEIVCYASLPNMKGGEYDYAIFDEGHNITELNSEFLSDNLIRTCMVLTATRPTDRIKRDIFKQYNLNSVYELTLQEASDLGIVAPYEITVITMHLDNTDRYIPPPASSKPGTKWRTEKEQYQKLTASTLFADNKFGFIKRSTFLKDLKSKTETAKLILQHVIPQDKKMLIFCGSVNQAIQVCDRRYYSKPVYTLDKKYREKMTKRRIEIEEEKKAAVEYKLAHWEDDKAYHDFKEDRINRMSCVDALNEGENIGNMDGALVIHQNGSLTDFIQRLGRTLRFRPDYVGRIIIMAYYNTIEYDAIKRLARVGKIKINEVELSQLRNQLVTINFD